ncbi:hypothetical protein MBLNU457_5324t1 [Dothideomycetes sp. NU457]
MDPVFLEDASIINVLDFIIETHTAPTTLIICSTRAAFIQDLLDADTQNELLDADIQDAEEDDIEKHKAISPLSHLLTPTLHLLSRTRTIDLAFCPDVPHLLAYLTLLSHGNESTTLHGIKHSGSRDRVPTIAILNPIKLYRSTSSFSVQGLIRFFACAVETADLLGRKLVIAECDDSSTRKGGGGDEDEDEDMQGDHEESANGNDERQRETRPSPWDQEVSMLNVTTKTFGAGSRGWAGRTVSVRRIAGRWCRFTTIRKNQSDEDMR